MEFKKLSYIQFGLVSFYDLKQVLVPNSFYLDLLFSPRRQMIKIDGHEGDARIFARKKLVGVLCGRTIVPPEDGREDMIRAVLNHDFKVLLRDGSGLGFHDTCFAAEAEALGCPMRPTSSVSASCHPSPQLFPPPSPLTRPFHAAQRKLPFGMRLFPSTSRKAIPATRSSVGIGRI